MGAKGHICYIELPAADPNSCADFYRNVFGWTIRRRGDGSTAFDDTTGHVSGAFLRGRAPSDPGLVVYIMVDNVIATVDKIIAKGGTLVQPVGADAPEITARFRDPAGNILGLYQEPERHEPDHALQVE